MLARSDVTVAKNYLGEKELKSLERIVMAYLEFAEFQAERQIPMAMDRQMWERIVLNLLANSKDFSYPGGEIHCNVSVEDNKLVVSIRDFGKGVPQELVSDIFSRYTGETKRGLRSGLGLYIVKELVTLMEGDVALSRAEPGTEVVIRAPIFQTEEKQVTMTVDDFFSDNMVQMELSNI